MPAISTSEAWHYIDGEWLSGNPPVMGALSHGAWMASTVFDGARAFEGVTPDLDLHCQRLVESARAMGLAPAHSGPQIEEILRDGVAKFGAGCELYIRPMYWAETGFVAPDPESTRYCYTLFSAPLPEPGACAITLSPYRRPTFAQAPTNAKAACLYPNSGRSLQDARARGFDNAVVLDALGNVAELATANLWLAKDGAAHTPAPNGTFLNGITRQRIAQLLRDAGIAVHERALAYQDFLEADEIFSTGNYGKVMPVTRIEARDLQPGPIYSKARELYWDWSHRG